MDLPVSSCVCLTEQHCNGLICSKIPQSSIPLSSYKLCQHLAHGCCRLRYSNDRTENGKGKPDVMVWCVQAA